MYLTLMQNVALLLALTTLYALIVRLPERLKTTKGILSGLLFGGVAVAGMLLAYVYAPGILIDGRSIVLSLAGFFGGWVPAVISASLALLFRAALGGPGAWAGAGIIVSATGAGLLFRNRFRKQGRPADLFALAMLGLVVHALMLACTLLIQPLETGVQVLRTVWLPVTLIFPAGTVAIGYLILNEETRLRAERELRKSEERFYLAFATSPDAININRMSDGLYVDINQGFTEITGYTREEVIGKTSLELNIWADPADRERLVKELQRTGVVNNMEAQFRMKDGSLRTGLMSARIIELNGEPHILSVTRDIEEMKQAQQRIQESQELFTKVFRMSPVPMTITRLEDGRIVHANDAFVQTVGYSREELLARSTVELGIWADAGQREEMARQLRETGRVRELPIQVRTKAGEIRDMLLSAEMFSERGEKLVIAAAMDITERVRTERELRRLHEERERLLQEAREAHQRLNEVFERITDGVVALDRTWHYTYLNRRAAQMLQRERPEDLLGKHIWTEYPEGVGQPFHLAYERAMATQEPVFLEEYYAPWKRWYENRIYPSPEGITIFFTDITERKETEKKLRELTERLELLVAQRTAELEEANRTLKSFLYSVSHDLRAPLRAISGFAEIIARRHSKSLNQEAQRYFNNIIEAAARMEELINGILRYARLGERGLQRGPVPLEPLISELSADFAQAFQEAGAELQVEPGLPTVMGARSLLRQIFANLIDNAVKYRRTDVPLRVRLSAELEGDRARICVADNGIGIPQEYQDKIFDLFQRLHSRETSTGTGIGLALVKKATEILGGTVEVESKPGEGSRFIVTLPLARGEDSTEE